MGPGTCFSGLKHIPDILGRTDFDFELFYFFSFLGVPHFWLGPTLGPLGPHVGPPTWAHPLSGWAPRGSTHLGPTWAHPLGPHVGPPIWDYALPCQAMPSHALTLYAVHTL